jgi:hypothetical protein
MSRMIFAMGLLASMSGSSLGCGGTTTAPATGTPPTTETPPATEPAAVLTPDECVAKGGETIGDPGDGSTRRNGCPGGRTLLGNVKIGIEGGICCAK